MDATRSVRPIARFVLAVVAVVPVLSAAASDRGLVAGARVSEESYRHYLDDMLYTHDGDSRAFSPEHDLAQANIAALLTGFGLTVTLEPFDYSGETYYNVVGTKLGITYPDLEFIIGAHYDSFYTPGADDNASGVSLVLESARVLSEYDSDYTIRFIAFDREEQGLKGSQAYVQAHLDDAIVGMISADMVAYNVGNDIVEIYGRTASNPLKSALADAVTTYGEGLQAAVYGGFDASDHAPFEWEGFEACLFIEEWGNPNYHTQLDSVDTPDYLDYAYAARMTRVVVGLLVDEAGVAVDLPDADFDGDGDVDLDDYDAFAQCFTGPDQLPDDPTCNFFDFDGDGDIDCADWRQFAAVWTEPGDPPVFWSCYLFPPEVSGVGGRCLSVTAPEHGMPMALLVTGDPTDAAVSCVARYVQPDGRLGTQPVYLTFDAWETMIVCDEEIVPGTRYRVQCDYGEPASPMLSGTATATTPVWGDTVGYFTGTEWTPPDGSVELVDAVAVLDKFSHNPTAPPLYRVDLMGVSSQGVACWPDQRIDIIDVLGVLAGFGSTPYWNSTHCPKPCGE